MFYPLQMLLQLGRTFTPTFHPLVENAHNFCSGAGCSRAISDLSSSAPRCC